LTVAKVDETRAKTVETLAKVDADATRQAIETTQAIGGLLQTAREQQALGQQITEPVIGQ
jgi:hypothetical protein